MPEELDISIVRLSDLPKENPRLRLDAQFQGKKTLRAIEAVRRKPHLTISKLAGKCLKGRNLAYSPHGDFPVVRSGDISFSFQPVNFLRSSNRARAFFLKPNDILISSIGQGSIGRIQLFRNVGEYATVSEVTVIRVPDGYAEAVAAFLASHHGQSQIARYVTGATGQLHLYPGDVDLIFIPEFSDAFRSRIAKMFAAEWESYQRAHHAQQRVASILLESLGLGGWVPSSPLGYTACASEALDSGRLDAQYFRPMFVEIETRLKKHGGALHLSSILTMNARGRQPVYGDRGLRVINSKHVRVNRVNLHSSRLASETGARVVIQPGDVLLNGTGDGTIGRAAPYLHSEAALPDNHVTVLRNDRLDPIYLAAFLNSPLGQWQIERHIKGSSGQTELYPTDIDKILVWDAPEAVQMAVRETVSSAFDDERKARTFLGAATRAVEIFTEVNEAAALSHLDRFGG